MSLKLVVDNTQQTEKKNPELKRYSVPVSVEYSGEIVVQASSKEEALESAKLFYARNGIDALEAPCIDVDFALGEDDENHITEVMENEEDLDV